jgi:ABC-type uncharacterized transport system substrate-binding protein
MPSLSSVLRTAAVLCLGVAAWALEASARAETVDVVLTEDSGVYAEVEKVLKEELAGRVTLHVMTAAAIDGGYRSDAQLIVTVGARALQAVRKGGGRSPVIGVLVPRSAYERIVHDGGEPAGSVVSAVYLDQPPERQLNLVRVVASGRQKIGFLVSSESDATMPAFRAAAREQKLDVLEQQVDEPRDLYSALRHLLTETDAVVALPDSIVYNAGTIANILITTYRAQQPFFGFSPAYVKAGAIAAVYSTPHQVAVETAGYVQQYLSGRQLAAPRYPRQFAVSVNPVVARSLGIAVDDETTVHDKLLKMERE